MTEACHESSKRLTSSGSCSLCCQMCKDEVNVQNIVTYFFGSFARLNNV